ncbi:MAG: hypothetical protein GYA55_10080 [SAR324 cluster bacterium]|uniref:Uncharacterized protein n=1 Tax=SAR324 cluster bacterium TaxID=2024889 RepID=A0A7X9FSL8_9DELT|nr:hypothetical protein [SAR324 cluster bacterium]
MDGKLATAILREGGGQEYPDSRVPRPGTRERDNVRRQELIQTRGILTADSAMNLGISDRGDALARNAEQLTEGKLRGANWCLRYVRFAIERTTGLNRNERAGMAIQSVEKFRHNPSFKEILVQSREDLKKLPRGTVVITANPRGGAGHAQIMLGNGKAASDFRHGLCIYRNASEFYAFYPIGTSSIPIAALSQENSPGNIPNLDSWAKSFLCESLILQLWYANQKRQEEQRNQEERRKKDLKVVSV